MMMAADWPAVRVRVKEITAVWFAVRVSDVGIEIKAVCPTIRVKPTWEICAL